jgi:hypothetical protein
VLDHERAPAAGGPPALPRPDRRSPAAPALADPEPAAIPELAGDELTRLPLARPDAFDQALSHLGVERATAVVVGQAHACPDREIRLQLRQARKEFAIITLAPLTE